MGKKGQGTGKNKGKGVGMEMDCPIRTAQAPPTLVHGRCAICARGTGAIRLWDCLGANACALKRKKVTEGMSWAELQGRRWHATEQVRGRESISDLKTGAALPCRGRLEG